MSLKFCCFLSPSKLSLLSVPADSIHGDLDLKLTLTLELKPWTACLLTGLGLVIARLWPAGSLRTYRLHGSSTHAASGNPTFFLPSTTALRNSRVAWDVDVVRRDQGHRWGAQGKGEGAVDFSFSVCPGDRMEPRATCMRDKC